MSKKTHTYELSVKSGTLKKLSEQTIYVPPNFHFTEPKSLDNEKNLQQGLAVALAFLGDSAAASAAFQQSNTEIPTSIFQFMVGNEQYSGNLESLPFNDGDEVKVVFATVDGETENVCFAVARPSDHLIAIRPCCTRGHLAVKKRARKRTLFVCAAAWIISFWCTAGDLSKLSNAFMSSFLVSLIALAFWTMIEWRLFVENFASRTKLTESILSALGVPNPALVDLPKHSKQTRGAVELPGYRWQFYRYPQPPIPD